MVDNVPLFSEQLHRHRVRLPGREEPGSPPPLQGRGQGPVSHGKDAHAQKQNVAQGHDIVHVHSGTLFNAG